MNLELAEHRAEPAGFESVRFTVVYRADYISGEPATSSETSRVEWVPLDQVDELQMDRSQRMRLGWAIGQHGTWIDPAGD